VLCSKCQQAGSIVELLCEQNACLVEPEIISRVNTGEYRSSWRASNYSMFWGRRLDEGISLRLGTLQPQKAVFVLGTCMLLITVTKLKPQHLQGETDLMTHSASQCLDWVDWYRGYGATTPCAPRPWASRPFVRRHLVPSVISRGVACQATPETSVSEERKWARNVRVI
jgi:hypothetical protein